jgi:hypothetical protein
VEDVEKLQALVVEHFDAIEPGLTVLDARLLLGHATIDVIGVDEAGTLVLGAVGFSANEEMLLKAVEAYSWCLEYPEALVRLYPSCQVSEDRPPRLLFVVERMPDAFHRKIKQLGFPEVDCVEFRHLEFDGVPAVYFESLLRLRRAPAPVAPRVSEPAPSTAPAGASGENVVTMSAPRPPAPKLPKAAPASPAGAPRAAERPTPSREPAPVVSMVTRQATVQAPRPERTRPVVESTLREPAPLVADPVLELESDPVVASLRETVIEPEVPAPPARPAVVDAVPSIAPRHVATATAPALERVSFKELATDLLGVTPELSDAPGSASASPVVPSVAPAVVSAAEPPAAPPVQAPAPAAPAPVIEAPAPAPATATAAPEPVAADPAKPAPPALPQGFEGLKFPNDGVLTRQWMEFLSQMSSPK